MNCICDEGCTFSTNIYYKHEPYKISDVDSALEEFKNMRTILNLINKDPMGYIKGPLSFNSDDVTVFILKTNGLHLNWPCMNPVLKKKSK